MVTFHRSDYGVVMQRKYPKWIVRPIWIALMAIGTRFMGSSERFNVE
jgi:hypothetical protein